MSTNNNEKNESLLNYLDNFFVVSGEMIDENGEDSYVFSVNDNIGMLGVFDGCGGIGSRKYSEYDNKSGAYIAARAASGVTMEWFQQICIDKGSVVGNDADELKEKLKNRLRCKLDGLETGTGSSALRGSLSKSFPTTASLILFEVRGKSICSSFIWAGDSRGFVLSSDGLCQITRDDIEGNGDALTNLSTDSKLTNLVSANEDFLLHSRTVSCDTPAVFITATDGCFGYFQTPMEFEFMLLESLKYAKSIEQWKNNLESNIRKFTADDYTIGIAVCGYNKFKNLKKTFASRYAFLNDNYISKLDLNNAEIKQALWEEYKKTYYRGA